MNRKIVLFALLLFVPALLSAQALSGWWTAGNIGFNYYASEDCSTKFLLDVDVLSFTFKHNDTGLMLSLTPFHCDSFCEDDHDVQEKNNIVSFLNAKVGFDILEGKYDLDLVPYFSISWMPLNEISGYRAEAGIEFTYFTDISLGSTYPFRIKAVSLKSACGLRRNKPYFTIGGSFDLSAVVYTVLYSTMESSTGKSN